VKLRRRLAVVLTALLGAAVVVLPAVAGSETARNITAVNYPPYYPGEHERHYWSPEMASLGAGGVATFSNPSSTVPHGLAWTSGPAKPACSGVPAAAAEESGATSWHGECTFGKPGTYTFICTVHPSEMKGTVTVNADGTTTTSVTMGSTETSPPSPTTSTSTASPGSELPTNGSGPRGSLLVGSASSAVTLTATQHGQSVHGSVAISQAATGARLEVELLARNASLASARRPTQVQVGRLVRYSLRPGTATFTVTLDAKARHALRVHGHLALTVKIVLTPQHGSAVTLIRSVVAHA
jgi:plastocyanin